MQVLQQSDSSPFEEHSALGTQTSGSRTALDRGSHKQGMKGPFVGGTRFGGDLILPPFINLYPSTAILQVNS